MEHRNESHDAIGHSEVLQKPGRRSARPRNEVNYNYNVSLNDDATEEYPLN